MKAMKSGGTSFGSWLKQRRRALDLTQDELARQVACSVATIYKLETDERRPSKQLAEKLAERLEIPAAQRATFLKQARSSDTDDGPSEAVETRPHYLPAPLTSLIGRDREIERIKGYLLRADVRLITLSGPPGVGKTRLSLVVAAAVAEHFADGVFVVRLAPAGDAGLVLAAIAQTLGLQEGSVQPVWATLTSRLRSTKTLLLLDNFEHVIAAAPLVASLLEACPQLKIMVTSRETLRITGEHELTLAPLSLPDLERLPPPEVLTGYAAVALFAERARAVQPDFVVTQENATAVAMLCHRLDGLPLAIELIAARIKLLPAQALIDRLDSPLALLTDGPRNFPARHQALRTAIAWSYGLLNDDERQLFTCLAVFAGGCDLEAVETLCGEQAMAGGNAGASILDRLASLVNKSLVLQQSTPAGAARFTMLETIREFAREQLRATAEETSGDNAADQVLERHAAYFLAFARRAEPELNGGDQVTWLDRLAEEHDNLRAALTFLVDRGDLLAAAHLAGYLWQSWLLRGHLTEGRRYLSTILEGCDADRQTATTALGATPPIPAALRAKLLDGAGVLASNQGDYAQATDLLTKSLAIWRELGDELGIAQLLSRLGVVAYNQGHYDAAERLCTESLVLFRKIAYLPGVANALNDLGLVAHNQHDYGKAMALYEESLELRRRLGDQHGIANSLVSLGFAAYSQRNVAEARPRFEESLAIRRRLGDLRRIAECLEGLAGAAWIDREPVRMARLLGAAEALREAIGTPIPLTYRSYYGIAVSTLRFRLGKKRFSAAWAEGRAFHPEEAIAYALHERDTFATGRG